MDAKTQFDLIADDHYDTMDITTRKPRDATEVRIVIGAGADFHSYIQGHENDKTYVVDHGDHATGKVGISHTHDAAYKAAEKLIRGAGGVVTGRPGKITKKAGTHGVTFRFDFDTPSCPSCESDRTYPVDHYDDDSAFGCRDCFGGEFEADEDEPVAVTDGGEVLKADDRRTGDVAHIRKADLRVGDAVAMTGPTTGTRYVVVTRLDDFDHDRDDGQIPPKIGPGDFGYVEIDANPEPDHVGGVSGVSNVEAVAYGDYFDHEGAYVSHTDFDLRVSDFEKAKVTIRAAGVSKAVDRHGERLAYEALAHVTDELTGHDIDTREYGFNYAVRCVGCDTVGVRSLTGPDPEDPDRYGNRRSPFKCPTCGGKGEVISGGHGGTDVYGTDGESEFEFVDRD